MLHRVGLGLVFVVALLAVAPAGAPVQLSYVYSDSMEPTIGTNDGYFVLPAGTVSSGDIVTFWSPEKDAYVTHRIVGESETGFITRGDNNPSSDQEAGYPAVSRDRIVGKVLTFDGNPVLVPHLGAGVSALRRNLLVVLSGLAVLMGVYSRRKSSAQRREVSRVQDIFRPLFAVCFVSITCLLVYGGGGHTETLVAVSSPGLSEAPNAVLVGSSQPIEFTITQPAWPLMHRVVGTRGMTITNEVRNSTAIQVNGFVTPPTETGPVEVGTTVNQYPAVVPQSVITRLQSIHPLLASGVCTLGMLTPFLAFYYLWLDPQAVLRQRPSRWKKVIRRSLK